MRASCASINWHSTSFADAYAISANRARSRLDRFAHPSARLDGIDATARRTCARSPGYSREARSANALNVERQPAPFLPRDEPFEVSHALMVLLCGYPVPHQSAAPRPPSNAGCDVRCQYSASDVTREDIPTRRNPDSSRRPMSDLRPRRQHSDVSNPTPVRSSHVADLERLAH